MSGGGLEQAYNAQAGVAQGSRLIVVNHTSPHPNDPPARPPAGDHLSPLPPLLGPVDLLTDHGYCSEAHVKAWEPAPIPPLLAPGRAGHPPTLEERFADPGEAPDTADPVARLDQRLHTLAGQALDAPRQSTVAPVVGLIQHVRGCRHLLLRGLQAVPGEGTLVCIAYHFKRLQVLVAG